MAEGKKEWRGLSILDWEKSSLYDCPLEGHFKCKTSMTIDRNGKHQSVDDTAALPPSQTAGADCQPVDKYGISVHVFSPTFFFFLEGGSVCFFLGHMINLLMTGLACNCAVRSFLSLATLTQYGSLFSSYGESRARYSLTEAIPLQVEHVAVEPFRPSGPCLRIIKISAK